MQDLIEGGWLNFKETEPSVSMNPLPPHGGPSVNVLSHEPIGQEAPEQGTPQIAVIEQTEVPFLKLLTIYYDPVQTPWTPLTISVLAQSTYHDNHADWSHLYSRNPVEEGNSRPHNREYLDGEHLGSSARKGGRGIFEDHLAQRIPSPRPNE
ncbi:hypothetical protein CR513_01721, partial [Mucuna pruriens]